MDRLLIHVEGQTEEDFVNEILAPHSYKQGYERVGARLAGNARQRDRRGGIRAWGAVRNDIVRHLKEIQGVWPPPWWTIMGCHKQGPGRGPGATRPESCRLPKKHLPWNVRFQKTFTRNWAKGSIRTDLYPM